MQFRVHVAVCGVANRRTVEHLGERVGNVVTKTTRTCRQTRWNTHNPQAAL